MMAKAMLKTISRDEAAEWLDGSDHVYPAPDDVDMLEGDWRADIADPSRKAFLCVYGAAGMDAGDLEGATAHTIGKFLSHMKVQRALVIGRGLMGAYEALSPSQKQSGWSEEEELRPVVQVVSAMPPGFTGAIAMEGGADAIAGASETLAHGAWTGGGLSGLWTWLCPDAGLILRSCHHRHIHTWPRDADAQAAHDSAVEALKLARQEGCAAP